MSTDPAPALTYAQNPEFRALPLAAREVLFEVAVEIARRVPLVPSARIPHAAVEAIATWSHHPRATPPARACRNEPRLLQDLVTMLRADGAEHAVTPAGGAP